MSRLGLRRRLLLVVLATVALVIAALVAGFNVLLARTLDGDARDLVRSRATARVASLRIDHGHLSVTEAPDSRSSDAYVWVFAGARALERPNTGASVDRAARGLAAEPARFVDVARSDTRLYGTPVVAGGRRIGTVVAAVSPAPVTRVSTAKCCSSATEMPANSRARSTRSLPQRATSRAPAVAAPTRRRSWQRRPQPAAAWPRSDRSTWRSPDLFTLSESASRRSLPSDAYSRRPKTPARTDRR